MTRLSFGILALVLSSFTPTLAFVVLRPPGTVCHNNNNINNNNNPTSTTSTRRYISDEIANMIDQELYREQHRHEFEIEWMKQNKPVLTYHMTDDSSTTATTLSSLTSTSTLDRWNDEENFRERARDRMLANSNPQAYCADRCLATGNCDVFEEFFEFTAQEVMEFCRECVLANDEEPCDVPDSFYRNDNLKKLRP